MTEIQTPSITVVVGGCGAIGLATAERLLDADPEGIVALLDLSPAAAQDLLDSQPGRLRFLRCDVSDPADVGAVFEQIDELPGSLTGLVYAAGKVNNSASVDLDFGVWREILAVNLDGALLCNQEAGRRMLAHGSGAIVNIASIAGLFGHPRRLPYSVSKAGIAQLTRTLAVEWGQQGVRVNAVAPGYVDTVMVREGEDLGLFSRQEATEMHAMKRLAEPGEIADAIVYLLSAKATFITGDTLRVDGGFSVLKAS